VKSTAASGLALALLISFGAGLAACDSNPFASKEKRERKHSRDDDEDDEKPRAKGSSPATSGLFGAERAVTKGVTPVVFDLHVMSQCPYGIQVENNLAPVLQKLGPYLKFRIEYVGMSNNGLLTSMHGVDEIAGDLAQVCAQKHTPRFLDLIVCQNRSIKEVGHNWEACADELGIEKKDIAKCIAGAEGQALLSESFNKSASVGARGSPTIMIGGQKHEGGRKPADLMKALCAKFSGTVPAECAEIPVSPPVNVTILRDDRCVGCYLARHEKTLATKVSNPVVTKLEYGSPEGKKLFDAIKPVKLPAFVFDATLDADTDAAASFKKAREVGVYRVVDAGDWNPVCADAGGCATEECKLTLTCRPEVPNKLEVFVMSQCPFGVKGMNSMKDVLDNFKKSGAKLDFSIHYIGEVEASGELKSLHGLGEVQEDLRQVCAISHYPRDFKFMNYIWCRNKDIKSDAWESCTGGATGIETKVIKDCSLGEEGKRLLKESFAISKASGINSSPTWLANGKFKFSGLDAQLIKTQVCAHNSLAGCSNTLPGPVK
jgi:predicted DsbA family dithiol-disulfide isomerase